MFFLYMLDRGAIDMRAGDGIIIMRALRLKNIGRRDPERKLLNGILGDADQAAVIGRALEDRYAQVAMNFVEAEPHADDLGAFTDFLKWIFENQEQIIAFITMLISLFSDDEN
jgi:hypothetical protein